MSAADGSGPRLPARRRPGHRRAPLGGVLVCAVVSVLTTSSSSRAWDAAGHRAVSDLAARIAVAGAADIPEFFILGGERVADASVEPDLRRNRDLDRLRSAESPEHYLDRELLGEAGLPETRYDYLRLLADRGLTAPQVGTVPYAVVESMQNLTLAFAEHRRRPNDVFIQSKVLYLAGVMSHYAADMEQPLHTTIHHDGRARPDMSSPRTGIHQLVDSLIARVRPKFSPPEAESWPAPFPDAWQAVLEELDGSHALVDRVYDLQESLTWDGTAPPAVVELTSERMAAAVAFTVRLFATAWAESARLELPGWRFDSGQPAPE